MSDALSIRGSKKPHPICGWGSTVHKTGTSRPDTQHAPDQITVDRKTTPQVTPTSRLMLKRRRYSENIDPLLFNRSKNLISFAVNFGGLLFFRFFIMKGIFPVSTTYNLHYMYFFTKNFYPERQALSSIKY